MSLEGRQIFISRDPADAGDFTLPLTERGARVTGTSLISVHYLSPPCPDTETFDWLVFTSRHGVEGYFRNCQNTAGRPVAAVGPRTADTLNQRQQPVALTPEQYHAGAAARALDEASNHPLRVLWPCGTRSRPELREALEAAGHRVESLTVYDTRLKSALTPQQYRAIRESDVIALTSPSSAQALGEKKEALPDESLLVAIGPSTAEAVRDVLGRSCVIAESHTLAGLAQTIMKHTL